MDGWILFSAIKETRAFISRGKSGWLVVVILLTSHHCDPGSILGS